MAHPAASIKSIYSGRMNIDGEEETVSFECGTSTGPDEGSVSGQETNDSSSKISKDSSQSVTSKNLRSLMRSLSPGRAQKVQGHNSWTNASVASTESDYQLALTQTSPNLASNSNDMAGEYLGPFPLTSFSRPLSRNSTTSCLSTTATKDGIEGKRLSRHGPSQYSNNAIISMLQSGATSEATPNPPKIPSNLHALSSSIPMSSMSTAPDTESITSQWSFRSTNAEIDGETAEKTLYRAPSPPLNDAVTLSEKINLINTDAIKNR